MKSITFAAAGFAISASAFPFVLEQIQQEKRQVPSTTVARDISAARGNCGVVPCLVFNEQDQYVSTTGDHAYASPAADEIRGPCPGLNAAANHGYLSHSGVTTIEETITGMGALFGMSPDLAGFLAAYAVIFDGDPILGTWSIGGPPPSNGLTKGLLGQAQGISYSHNVYEGDSSIGRRDAYLNNGDAHSLDPARFASAYALNKNNRYTLDLFAQNFAAKAQESISTNPYYFAAPFSTTLVSPAAYNFVINFMSNHSAEEPNGYLDGEMFKTWFAIEGDYPNFKWLPGQERIPDNWYKRTTTNEYNAVNVFMDLGVNFLAYPDSLRLGGNTNGVNSYAGVDLADLTGGLYNVTHLLDQSGQGGACFFAQLAQAIIPDAAATLLGELSPILNLVNKFIKPIIPSGLNCPTIDKYDQTLFNKFPGYTYSPSGPATNY